MWLTCTRAFQRCPYVVLDFLDSANFIISTRQNLQFISRTSNSAVPSIDMTRRTNKLDFSQQATQTASLLTKLPAEIRNDIFELVAADTTMQYTRRQNVGTHEEHSGKPSPPGYLFTCKHVYLESIEVLYANAIFNFGTQRTLVSWIDRIPTDKRQLVKEIGGSPQLRRRFLLYVFED